MSKLNISRLTNENEDGAPRISGISTFSSTHYFVPPSGTTAERPSHADPGMIRFNTDSGHLEYYTGEFWDDVIVNNNDLGGGLNGIGTTASTQGTGTRAFIAGGLDPGTAARIDYITIDTFGMSQDFGDLTGPRQRAGAVASRTRGIIAGGYTGSGFSNQISKITIASTGDATDTTGDLTQSKNRLHGCSNSTRGIFAWGNPSSDVIEYITISSDGHGQDFGDTSYAAEGGTSVASPVRAVFAGGHTPSPVIKRDGIQFVTISSTGNGQDFGTLSSTPLQPAGLSNSTRGIFAGGYVGPNVLNTIEFVTIATTGNAQDFGDLTGTRFDMTGSSNRTRGVICGGSAPGLTGVIDSLEIASTGNAVDFGDMQVPTLGNATSSNGHGGL